MPRRVRRPRRSAAWLLRPARAPEESLAGLPRASPSARVTGQPCRLSVLVAGSAFVPGSTILLNGTPLPTIFLGESAVTGDIVFNPGDVPRTATVTVETPG